ncbi:MAG TPA: hypothetical protein VGT03_08810 [Candidatus Acidoferrales bacterium]|nr:hypothetical protein [Candidatus Acidoferrales bacterium]
MKRFSFLVVLAMGFLFGTQCALATTLLVGTCRKGAHFTTISAAVAAATTGATVDVCPGTYPEQVIISTPLNLTGITSNVSGFILGRVIIASPSGGLAASFTSPIDAAVVSAQVLVTTGPVNITNITVDGKSNGVSSGWIVGIAYESGASGTVNAVTAREQNGVTRGAGVWAENADITSETVTIENSEVRDANSTGILVRSGTAPPTLLANIVGNQIINTFTGITDNAAGSVTGNVIILPNTTQFGIEMDGFATASVVGNAISTGATFNGPKGILVNGTGEIIKSNTIFGFSTGIDASGASGGQLEANKITDSINSGIVMACQTNVTVSGNILNDVHNGLNSVSKLTPPGTYHNVDVINAGGC